MNRQPFLILISCFILGIIVQDKFVFSETIVDAVIGVCLIIFISTFFKSYFLHKAKPYLLGVMFFGLGIILHFLNTLSKDTAISSNQTIVFKVSKKLNSTEKNKKYEVIVQADGKNFNAILFIPKTNSELDFKHYYKAEAYITKAKPPQYDFQFDYAQYLKRKNIAYQCYVNNRILSAPRIDLNINEKISQKRLEVLQSIDKTEMSKPAREFLKGIILADRTEIDSDTVQDFNKTGLMHFLAISGTHIVVIFGLFYFSLIRIFPLRFRKYTVIASLIFIWLFAVFIGFGNSVLRSCIMLSVYYTYVLLQRKPDLLHSLALSAFIILFLDTQQIFDVGFQLSFMAVLGIFWLNQPILRYFPKQDNYMKKIIFNTISISVSAQLATLPLVLYYFHQFSFISIIANFMIVPFSEIIIVFSFLMTGLISVHLDFNILDLVYDFVIRVLLNAIHWFAGFDRLFINNISMSFAEVACLFLICYLLRFVVLKFNLKNSVMLMMAILSFFIVRTGLNIMAGQKQEILIHDFYKTKVFSVKKGNKACFWIKKDSDRNKVIQYIINPYCTSRRLDKVEVKTFPTSVQKVVYNGKIYNIN